MQIAGRISCMTDVTFARRTFDASSYILASISLRKLAEVLKYVYMFKKAVLNIPPKFVTVATIKVLGVAVVWAFI